MTSAKAPYPHPSTHLGKRRLETIRGYVVNEKRTPSDEVLVVTPSQTIGPFFPRALLRDEDRDLTRTDRTGPRAAGEVIHVHGRISDEEGCAVPGALIEIWQANKWGKYDHPADQTDGPVDPNFRGYGRTLSDENGGYAFLTIKPGGYPNPGYDNWMRPPHIHFSIFAAGLMQRIITQLYFPGEEMNDIDPILNGVEDLRARQALISREEAGPDTPAGTRGFRFDIVLRGRLATPFFVE